MIKHQDGATGQGIAFWKWASIGILIYVFIAGWFVPLGPGITEVRPGKAAAGDSVRLEIKGYNTQFLESAKDVRVWLRLTGDTVLLAHQVQVIDDRNLRAYFHIPAILPFDHEAYPMSLIIDQGKNGSAVLPNALFISPPKVPNPTEMGFWLDDKIENIHLSDKMHYPFRNILAETIRNTYFHVPMWFGMILLFGISAWYSLSYYRTGNMIHDLRSLAFVEVGLLFGVLGLVTGMVWAKYTWNAYWSWDVKQTMSAITLLIYSGLTVLRSSIDDSQQKARVTAGYNLFAFALVIPLLFIVPRMTDSLHPGSGGNPALGGEDLDNTMRMVFYPAVIGFTMVGIWLSQITFRIKKLSGVS